MLLNKESHRSLRFSIKRSILTRPCSVAVVAHLVVGAVLEDLLERLVEGVAPDAQDQGAVHVEGSGQLHQAVRLVRHRLHQHDLVGEAQVDDQRGASHHQVGRHECLDEDYESVRVVVAHQAAQDGDHGFDDSAPDGSDDVVALTSLAGHWQEDASNAIDGSYQVDGEPEASSETNQG